MKNSISVNDIEKTGMYLAMDLAKNGEYDKSANVRMMIDSTKVTNHEGIYKAKELGFVPGAEVYIAFTDHDGDLREGVIENFRYTIGGLYCGTKYPINVRIPKENVVYEFDLDSVILKSKCDMSVFAKKDYRIALYAHSNYKRKIMYLSNHSFGVIDYKTFLQTYTPDTIYELTDIGKNSIQHR